MHYTKTTFAALGFAAISSAHMIMNTPVPYGKSTLNNSPLAADGSDFPCKLRGTTFAMEDPSNVMAVGSSQNLAFTGSAVHGGGSCQISIAMLPSGTTLSTLSDSDAKSLSFKVIHSIQGGCPEQGVVGNSLTSDSADAVDPSTYNFTIPASVPAGNATLAWTWFNKIGNREMYMNCAPVTITSSSSKRDTSAFTSLPDMFVANVGNQCTSQDSKDLVFPDPGDSLVLLGGSTASSALATPTGAGCAAKVVATGATSAAATTAAPATSAPAATTAAGGVFVTVPAASSAAQAPATSVAATTPVVVATSAAASAAPTGTTGSGSAIAAGTACTSEGMFNCIAGTSFQQCASGSWSAVQSVADGTACTPGQSMDITITAAKRDIKHFPREHLRRHMQRSN